MSTADYRREQQRRARAVIDEAARRGFVINIDDDDQAGPSTDPKGKGLKEPKPELPADDDSGDYTSMYRRLGLTGDH